MTDSISASCQWNYGFSELFGGAFAHIHVYEDSLLAKTTGNQGVKRVAIAILHYLREHPLAKDNVKGIAEWWIGEDQGVVEQALDLLVERRVIEKSGDVYRLGNSGSAEQLNLRLERVLRTLEVN